MLTIESNRRKGFVTIDLGSKGGRKSQNVRTGADTNLTTITKSNNLTVVEKENLIFDIHPTNLMAEETFMYAVTTGIFAFLVAVLFGTRAVRKRKEPENRPVETESSSYSGSSGSGGKRIKRFKSDGSPVYEE
jgi:hypothetical protein